VNGPLFAAAELSFGRHHGRLELPTDRPALIAGPNGSGKTTLVDGILRTVFGFNRRSPDDRRLADARRPWNEGRPFRSTVRIIRDGTAYEWDRDHETDEVRVVDSRGTVVFEGTANAGARSSSDREYWNLVRRLFGVADLDAYARTALVSQGRLLSGTDFDAGLLRLADGGHARWQEARRRIEARHRELTREPISPDQRRLGRDRELETVRAELADVRTRRDAARSAVESRTATAERLSEVEAKIGLRQDDLAADETRRLRLLERARLDAEIADARQRWEHLVDLRNDLEEAKREVDEAEKLCATFAAAADLPDDLPARATEIRAAWQEISRLSGDLDRARPVLNAPDLTPWIGGILGIGGLLAAAGLWLGWAAGPWFWTLALVGLALLGIGMAELRARRASLAATGEQAEGAGARRDELTRRVAGLLEGVPGAGTLDAAGLEELLGQYDRRRSAENRRDAARARRSEIMRRIEKAGEAQDRPGRDLHRLVADAGRRLTGLEDQRRALVDEQDGAADDAPLSARAVEQRLDATRNEIEELRRERDHLRIALDRTTRSVGDLVRLEERTKELERRRAEIESTVAALRTAHTLLRDGYDEFRDQDEARLVAAVSGHLEGLGEPPLGPFRTEAGLEAPTVGLSRRRLPFDSPELSHGQRHLVMLAVRLGAADFLSLDAPAAPLIVDEPFAHLDDRHAAQVWNLLRDIAVHRQVIITTQEEDLLERLGVAATIRLAGDEVAATTGGSS